MNYEDIEGLSDSQILELYDDDLESISTEWYIWCANGRTGFYGDTFSKGIVGYCSYCDTHCETWRNICGGTTFNGRYGYECITKSEPSYVTPNSGEYSGRNAWWLFE